jgi:hypothetical protein
MPAPVRLEARGIAPRPAGIFKGKIHANLAMQPVAGKRRITIAGLEALPSTPGL